MVKAIGIPNSKSTQIWHINMTSSLVEEQCEQNIFSYCSGLLGIVQRKGNFFMENMVIRAECKDSNVYYTYLLIQRIYAPAGIHQVNYECIWINKNSNVGKSDVK